MGHKQYVHYWHLKKEIESIDAFVKFWWPSGFFLQDCKKCEFLSLRHDFIFSQIPSYSGSPVGQLLKKCTPKIASEASKWALLLEFFAWESKGRIRKCWSEPSACASGQHLGDHS
jgi:hypothetical protein